MRKIKLFFLPFLAFFVASCDEIIDEDISDKELEIVAPVDLLQTTKTTLTFWWEELDEASLYQLQIVSPNFENVLSNPLDTNISGTKYVLTLNPGQYQWRVRAKNSASVTDWIVRSFEIQDVPDLSDQEVSLKSPKEQDVFGVSKIKFQWYKLPNATDYALIVKRDSWEGSLVFPMAFTVYDTLTKSLDDGKYVWGVRAFNDDSQSKILNNTFFVDLTPPEKPILVEPTNNTVVTSVPVSLKWDYSAVDLTPVYDSIYIATESSFLSNKIIVRDKSTTKAFSFSTSAKGNFYWRVKTIDKAGNRSAFSETYSFVIN